MAKVPEVTRGVVSQQPRETIAHLNAIGAYLRQSASSSFATQAQAEAGAPNVNLSPAIAAFLAAMPKAFVQFDASSGTPVVKMSYNVDSITDRGVGLFTINFTSLFSSNAIGMAGSADDASGNVVVAMPDLSVAVTASAFPIKIRVPTVGNVDAAYNFVVFYGDLA